MDSLSLVSNDIYSANTVLAPKRLECVLFQFYVIFLAILHAMDKLNIPQ